MPRLWKVIASFHAAERRPGTAVGADALMPLECVGYRERLARSAARGGGSVELISARTSKSSSPGAPASSRSGCSVPRRHGSGTGDQVIDIVTLSPTTELAPDQRGRCPEWQIRVEGERRARRQRVVAQGGG
jgi:hypothetical protein